MAGWLDALSRTRNMFGKIFSPAADVTDEEIEEILLRSDVSAQLAADIVERLASGKGSKRHLLREMLLSKLNETGPFQWPPAPKPYVVLLLGSNGSGKTTTAAKLAKKALKRGLRPMLCGSDTFRAAGSSQLKRWSERIGCDFVGGEKGRDAAGVAFHAVDLAVQQCFDAVFVDTAGRMHTRTPLMEELPKMCRAMDKRCKSAPNEVWMVLDASLGQNAVVQAKQFNKVVPLTGIIVAKLDGSSKAGFLFSICSELKTPVLFAGLGEGENDLESFNPEKFVDALLCEESGR